MVSHWWKAFRLNPARKAAKAGGGRKSVPRLESLEGRWVPSASPVTAHVVAAVTTPTPTDALTIDREFAARLEHRLDRAKADVRHDQRDIDSDKSLIAHLGREVAHLTSAIAHDTNPAILAADRAHLVLLTAQLGHANHDLAQDTTELAAAKVIASNEATELHQVRAVIALEVAGATHDANYATQLGLLATAVRAEATAAGVDIAADNARLTVLHTRLTAVNAAITTDTGEKLAADRVEAALLNARIGRLEIDVTHDAAAQAAEQAYASQLIIRQAAVMP
jgi:hypothetical protein